MEVNRMGSALGRVLMSSVFLISGVGNIPHFGMIAGVMRQMGLPAPVALLAISIALQIGGGLMLLAGFKARYAALALAAWLVPVTLSFHNFWAYTGPQQQEQMVNFLKNLAIMGGLLYFGLPSSAAADRHSTTAA